MTPIHKASHTRDSNSNHRAKANTDNGSSIASQARMGSRETSTQRSSNVRLSAWLAQSGKTLNVSLGQPESKQDAWLRISRAVWVKAKRSSISGSVNSSKSSMASNQALPGKLIGRNKRLMHSARQKSSLIKLSKVHRVKLKETLLETGKNKQIKVRGKLKSSLTRISRQKTGQIPSSQALRSLTRATQMLSITRI